MEPSSGGVAGHRRRRRRVVLFPLPYQGHLIPMLRLAAALHGRGLAIIVLHADLQPLEPPANHSTAEYRFESLSAADVPAELIMASKDIARVVMRLNASFAAPFKERVAALAADKESGGVDCVITDAVWFSAQAAAQELGVPSLGLLTNSAASFRTFMAYPTLIHKGYLPVQESQKDAPVPELPPFRVKDLERIDASSLEDFASMLGNVVARVRQASGLILNSFDAIEASNVNKIREDLSIPVFAVGPLNKLSPSSVKTATNLVPGDHHRGCLDWLDTQAPGSVLYVSFGSVAAMDARHFAELAWGLADSKRPFVWVVRGCSESGKLKLPDGVEEDIRGRARIVSWAPQEEVLSHPAICAFLTHNGWNSTVESISQGVPMLCWPCFGDQFGTARYVCHLWKVGVEIGVETTTQLQRGSIRAAIDRLMDDKQAKEYRRRAKDLKEMAEKCATKDGSSHRALVSLVDFIMSL